MNGKVNLKMGEMKLELNHIQHCPIGMVDIPEGTWIDINTL